MKNNDNDDQNSDDYDDLNDETFGDVDVGNEWKPNQAFTSNEKEQLSKNIHVESKIKIEKGFLLDNNKNNKEDEVASALDKIYLNLVDSDSESGSEEDGEEQILHTPTKHVVAPSFTNPNINRSNYSEIDHKPNLFSQPNTNNNTSNILPNLNIKIQTQNTPPKVVNQPTQQPIHKQQPPPQQQQPPPQQQFFPPWYFGIPNFPPGLIQKLIFEQRLPNEVVEAIKRNYTNFMNLPKIQQEQIQRDVILFQQQMLQQQLNENKLNNQNNQTEENDNTSESPSKNDSNDKNNRRNNKNSAYKLHSHVHNIDWRKNKNRMTAQEIASILKVTNHQLKFSNYAQDFYYQTYMKKYNKSKADNSFPPVQSSHEPIAFIGKAPKPSKNTELFAGVLGIVPSGSARAPRLEIELGDTNSINLDHIHPEENFNPELSRPLNMLINGHITKHATSLVIEELFDIALDLEDLNHVLEGLDPQVNHAEFEEASDKKDQILHYLNQRLVIFLNQENPLAGNPLFPLLLQSSKGIKLISRIIKLIPHPFVFPFLSLSFLNLHLLKPHFEDPTIFNLFDSYSKVVGQYDAQHLSILFYVLLHSQQQQPQQHLEDLLSFYSSKPGCIILSALLRVIHQHSSTRQEWPELFNTFFSSFQNKFLDISDKLKLSSEFFWQLLASVTLHCNEDKKKVLRNTLQENLSENLKKSQSQSLKQLCLSLNIN